MAKNKNKFSNVVIKDEELTPTTIGVYSNKTKNPITLMLLIAAFIAIVIFMPDIQNYVNKYMGKTTNNNSSSNSGSNNSHISDNDDNNDTKKTDKYDIATIGNVETSDYDLKNIKLDGTTMSFTFVNKTKGAFDLSDYYLELYSSDNTFVGRVKVSNDTIELNDSEDYSYTILSNAKLFSFDKKTLSDYPEVTLNYNENNEANYICKNGSRRYTYQFIDNQLTRVLFVYNLENTVANYYEEYASYENKSNTLGLIPGVTASFSSTLSNFNFNLNVDLTTADISKLDDDNIYKSKTTPKEVKFKAEAQGFSCSQ